MLFFIVGASGSGKTACITSLKELLPNSNIQDFDDIGTPENADARWRQEATERWLQKYFEESGSYDSYCICGQAVLGEILACPTSLKIPKINICLLDVADIERINRLQNRGTFVADQNMLNWAAWLRMHHHDPQWEQHVIKNDAWSELNFALWDKHDRWNQLARTFTIDTTSLSISEVAYAASNWITTAQSLEAKDINNAKLLSDKSNVVYPERVSALEHSKSQATFAVIYRGYLKQGMEEEYKNYWNKIASFFIKFRGAIGSCLHKTEEGMWLAYSKWPSKEMRDNAWPEDESVNKSFPKEIKSAIIGLKQCLDPDRNLPEITMEVINDLMSY